MSDTFDPYFKWLGIPKFDQPPHAYRLLGIELFESDADVISNAADGRMAQIKSFQAGKFGAVSQKLLNEIAAAKVCLLMPEKKAAYDQRLRTHLQKKSVPVLAVQVQKPPVAEVIAAPSQSGAGLSFLDDLSTAPTRTTARPAARARKSVWLVPTMFGVLAVAVVAGAVGIYLMADKLGGKQANLQGDNHHSAQPDISQVKAAGSGDTKLSGSAMSKATYSGQILVSKPSAATAVQKSDTEPKKRSGVAPGPESPQLEEASPKTNPEESTEKPVPDQTPPKELEPVKKSPMPAPAQFQAMKSKIFKIYQEEFADAKTAEAKLALAAKLDAQADSSKGNPDERFALWRMAAEKATEAGDVSAAIGIVDKIAVQFEGDFEAIKYELLAGGATRATSTPEGAHSFCEAAMKLATLAVAREDFEAAARYANLATGSLRRVKDPQFSRDIVVHDREIERLKTRYAVVSKAMETLKDDPDSAAANLTVGQWRCFVRGDWEKGLPYLAKGSWEDVAHLAKQELAKPAVAAKQAAIADGWWALAEKDRSETKAAFRARALRWYKLASPGLSGLEKVRVDKQIETLVQSSSSEPHQPTSASKGFGARGVVQTGNVALLSNGTTVEGIDDDRDVMLGENIIQGRASSVRVPGEFTVTLDKTYLLQQIRFLIYADMNGSYAVLVSRDGLTFDLVADHRREGMKGWQELRFSARPVKKVRFVCTNSSGNYFEVAKLEAYCNSPTSNGTTNSRTHRGGR
jgi:hypothetical protein